MCIPRKSLVFSFFLFLLSQEGSASIFGGPLPVEDVSDARFYNQVAWLSAHNAFNNREDGWWINNNQLWSYEKQYQLGVRGFFLDLYWYDPGAGVKSYIALCHENEHQIGLFFGGCPLTLATRLGAPPKFETFLKHVKGWLQKDPATIVTLHLENYLGTHNKEPLNALLEKTDLAKFLFKKTNTGKIEQKIHWKTLEEMRRTNQRLVIFSDSKADGFINVESYRETKYDLDEFSDCEMRGEGRSSTSDLFVLNHFYAFPRSLMRNYVNINSFETISNRIVKCCQEQGRLPNFIALDFVEQGEAGKIISRLNKLNFSQPDPKVCASIITAKTERIEPRNSEL